MLPALEIYFSLFLLNIITSLYTYTPFLHIACLSASHIDIAILNKFDNSLHVDLLAERQNRKILEQLEEQKKRLRISSSPSLGTPAATGCVHF